MAPAMKSLHKQVLFRILPIVAGLLTVGLLAACASGQPTQAAETNTPPAATQPPTAVTQPAPTVIPENHFANPVLRANFPDPFLLKEGDTWYAYATNGSSRNVQLATSTDLVQWKVQADAMPSLAPWVKLSSSDVWAPEVLKTESGYNIYYTARDKTSGRQCVGVAVSDKPQGKFRDANDAPLVCQVQEGGTIDASPFRDGEKLYLYYKNDGNCCGIPTFIYVQEMTPDGLGLVGEPVQLVRNNGAWEGRVVEAPTMWNHDGKYFLFFSANDYADPAYAVGYATCETPMGPCEDAPENPILKSRMDVQPFVVGPGHQTIITTGGQDWIVYHAWQVLPSGMRSDNRFMWIDRLDWEDGAPVVRGPTSDPQPKPEGD
jgi:beta-xylosidase